MPGELTTSAGVSNPLTLINAAVAKGIAAEELGKLLDLQERWERNQALIAFNEAMSACQAEMPVIVKDDKNPSTGSRYASLGHILETIRPTYTKHGFSVGFDTEPAPQGEDDVTGYLFVAAHVAHKGGHTRIYRGKFPLDLLGPKGTATKSAIHAHGSTYHYARRYLHCQIWDLVIKEEDNDKPRPAPTMTPDQVHQLEDLITACRSAGATLDTEKFLQFLGAKSMLAAPAVKFQAALGFLQSKLFNAQERARAAAKEPSAPQDRLGGAHPLPAEPPDDLGTPDYEEIPY